MKKSIIYARVSSTDESQSYDRQISDLNKYATFKNLEVVNTFAEKISGFKKGLDERVEFNKMLTYVDDNNIKQILVSELSRISRRYIDSVNFINDCSKKGINILILKEGFSTLNSDGSENTMVQMIVGILSSMSQEESKSLSYRVKSGKDAKASLGGNVKGLYGYDIVDGFPIINEYESMVVKKMFELSILGNGSRLIANYINESFDTKHFKDSTITYMLKNPFYCGERLYKGITLESPSIVSKEVFEENLMLIEKRKKVGNTPYININPFASFIKCECGSTMRQIINQHGANFYRCPSKCGVGSVNRPFLIHEVREALERNAKLSKEKQIRERLQSRINVELSSISVAKKRLNTLDNMKGKNYEAYLESKVDEIRFNKYNTKIDLETTNLTKQISDLNNSVKAIKDTLSNDIIHYSLDLSTFKTQVLNSIEWITIKDKIAILKIKGWAKQVIVLYRGSKLQLYNRRLRESKNK